MTKPFNLRSNDVFLSHAHADSEFARALSDWLSGPAGLAVFYDPETAAAGTGIASMLRDEIGDCRSVVIILSDASVKSSWVEKEFNIAEDESAQTPGFRVVPIRIKEAAGKDLIQGVSWIDVPDGKLTEDVALRVLRGLYRTSRKVPRPRVSRDVYVSASWDEDKNATLVCEHLADRGFRLIGDMKDQPKFDLVRIRRIMECCGAFVSVVPFQGKPQASSTDRPYKYLLQEVDMAAELGLSPLVIADPRVQRSDGSDAFWLRMPADSGELPAEIATELDRLWDFSAESLIRNHVFIGLSQETERESNVQGLCEAFELVTGLGTILGTELRGQEQAAEIERNICEAALVVADITGDNVNVCVEAGMAKSHGRPYELMSKGATRSPPFMIRGPNMEVYEDGLEQLGKAHRIAHAYRRRIINIEL
jgi:hypothetical protein